MPKPIESSTEWNILLLLLGIDLVFARSSGGTTATEEERNEAKERTDISVSPLATPLIAGPGSMGVTILLIADAEGDLEKHAAVIGALLVVLDWDATDSAIPYCAGSE